MSVALLERHWVCPNCTSSAVTRDSKTPMHPCRGLAGLMVALIPDGVRAKVETVDREDYLHGDLPQRDGNGRVVMAVLTTRDDGQDCTVLAPTAVGDAREGPWT